MEFTIAKLATPEFKFEGVGGSAEEAMSLLELAWRRHCAESGRPEEMLSFDTLMAASQDPASPYTVVVTRMEVGWAYRNGVKLAA